jgi:hypothetical protein
LPDNAHLGQSIHEPLGLKDRIDPTYGLCLLKGVGRAIPTADAVVREPLGNIRPTPEGRRALQSRIRGRKAAWPPCAGAQLADALAGPLRPSRDLGCTHQVVRLDPQHVEASRPYIPDCRAHRFAEAVCGPGKIQEDNPIPATQQGIVATSLKESVLGLPVDLDGTGEDQREFVVHLDTMFA